MAATPSEFDTPKWWHIVFGDFDAYREWVHDRYFWDPLDPRTVADTRSLWSQRLSYDEEDIVAA